MPDKQRNRITGLNLIAVILFTIAIPFFLFHDVAFNADNAVTSRYDKREPRSAEDLLDSSGLSSLSVDQIILEFKRKLLDSERFLLEQTLEATITFEFSAFPLYVVPRFSQDRLFNLPDDIRGILNGIYPNVRQKHSLAQAITAGLPIQGMASQGLSMENVTSFKKRLLEAINVTPLHSTGISGANVTVGIIDTGVDPNHPELAGKIIAMESFVRKELGYSATIANATDSFGNNGHGTGVASLIVGEHLGIAPGAKLVSAKVIHDASVRGAGNGTAEETTGGILAAIDYMVAQRVDIVSISLGQYLNLPMGLREAYIDNVSKKFGILFVIAAGNFGYRLIGGSSLSNPGTSLQAITVGAASLDSVPSTFSSEGPRSDGVAKPDLVAPGEDIIFASAFTANGYAIGSGTSFATPIVAGVAALLVSSLKQAFSESSRFPGLVKALLLRSARKLVGIDCVYPFWKQGFGMINAGQAWNLLLRLPTDPDSRIPLISVMSPWDPSLPIYKILYRDQVVHLPLTVMTSVPISLTSADVFIGNIQILNINFTDSPLFQGRDSLLFNLTFKIPDFVPLGFQEFTVTIQTNNSRITPMISWFVHVGVPRARVLMDFTHAMIVQRGIGAYRSILGNTATIFGGFRELGSLLLEQGIAVELRTADEELNISRLHRYDAYFLIEPATQSWHPFMDWINSPSKQYLNLDNEEISVLKNFSTSGGRIFVLLRGMPYSNVSNVNELLRPWGMELSNSTELHVTATIDADFSRELNVTGTWKASILATPLHVINDDGTTPILRIDSSEQVIGSGYKANISQNVPNVLIFGSSELFDNFGLKRLYDSMENKISTKELVTNVMMWIMRLNSFMINASNMLSEYCIALNSAVPTAINSEYKDDFILMPPIILFFTSLFAMVIIGTSSIKLFKVRHKKDE